MNFYTTDFGEVQLSDRFIAEANARWRDRRCTVNPPWIERVAHPLCCLLLAAVAKNVRVKTVKSIAALGFT